MTRQKSILGLLCLLLVNLLIVIVTLQGLAYAAVQPPAESPNNRGPLGSGGGGGNGPHDELSAVERQAIQAEIDHNIALLEAQGKLPAVTPVIVLFGWPIRPSPKLNDYGYHGISNLVDQNPTFPNQILDYACGDRTYDTSGGYNHAGTDIFPWPLGWNRVDANELEVVAAAPGVIVYKQDGNYDRNCSVNGSPWNAIFVRHGDGSVSWYGHLKRGSLTPKGIGATVAAGEYLGIVGSSGNSTGPHLHFEIYDASDRLIDPYAGSCNALNGDSWWIEQRPYFDSAVNKVTTGDAPVDIAPCPAPDNLHIQDNFMPGDFVYFTTYYRDQLAGQESQYTIRMPNGVVYYSWSDSSEEDHYQFSYWWWFFWLVPESITGTWRFEVEYEGGQYQTYFNWGDPTFISVTSPAEGNIWFPGSTRLIRWDDNLGGDVRLELYQAGNYFKTLAYHAPSDGTFSWTLPLTLSRNTQYAIRVINTTNETLYADSGAFYATFPLTVTAPQPLERWQPGNTYTITWQDTLTNPMRLELLHLGELSTTLAFTTTNDGVFTWTVPLTVPNMVGYQVRVVDVLDEVRYGESGYFFIGDPLQTFLPVVLKPES